MYGELSDPTYAAELATVLVKEDSIEELLIYLLQNNRSVWYTFTLSAIISVHLY